MNNNRRNKYVAMPLRDLRRLRDDLQELVADIEKGPRREIDIASDHTGDPALIVEVVRIVGSKESGKWGQVERILCSEEKCPKCPHGDFMYEYRKSKKDGKVKVTFKGIPLDIRGLRFYKRTKDGGIRILDQEEETNRDAQS